MAAAWTPPESDFQDASWAPPEHELEAPPAPVPTQRSIVGRNPTMGNFDTSKGASASELTQAGASGMNANVADVLGFPMDTATNVSNLVKGGASYAMLKAGYSPPSWLNFDKPENVPGTSDYLKGKARAVDPNLVDVAPNANGQDLSAVHTIGEMVGPGGVTGEAARLAGAVRDAKAAFAAGKAPSKLALAPAAPAAPKPAPVGGGFKVGDLADKPAAPSVEPTKANTAPEASAAPVPAGKAAEPVSATAAPKVPEPARGAPEALDHPLEFLPPKSAVEPTRPQAAPEALDHPLEFLPPKSAVEPTRPQAAPEALGHPLEFLPPEVEGTKTAAIPSAEQESRAETLRAIGLKEVRQSALTGDYKETGIDFQTSQLDHTGGKRMNSVMENERRALHGYSEGLVEKSGGTAGTDSVDRRMRGKAISAPIEAYDKALEVETKRLYTIADQRAAGQPIQLKGVGDLLANKSEFLGTTEGKQLLEGVTARAKELGLLGDNEVFHPATVEQAERLRQYLNENYSPRAGKLIAKLKNAIDEDVTKAAGADIYAAGRKVREARSANLEEPEGVSKLLAPDDRLGINRDVAHEDIPKYVTSLDADQFDHVVRVLKESGRNPAIEPQAVKALNEIRGTFANAVRDAGESTQGMWNAKGVNKYLRDNRARMEQVFSPAEMKEYQTLNDGGRILRMDRTYPGAAAQGHNFVVNGVLKGAEHGSTAVGGVMAHVPGMIVGHAIGKGAKVLDSKALSWAVEKRIRNLSTTNAR